MKRLITKRNIILLSISIVLVISLCVGGCFVYQNSRPTVADTEETEASTLTEDEEVEEETTEDEKPTDLSHLLRHAPNMYLKWGCDNEYDAITIDWRCTEDAHNTYWAVHNWSYGYAGFQTFLGKHLLILSLWDLPDGTRPTVEYSVSDAYGDFGGEGEGKKVYTEYDWKVNTWYSMKIERLFEDGKTFFTQYIREENGEWLKTATISYPVEFPCFDGSSLFQEDFLFNNLRRSCEVKNAGGQIANTDEWEMWKKCEISNSFFPTDEATWEDGVLENISYNCDYTVNENSVRIQSGGYDDTPVDKKFPYTATIK